MQNSTKIPTSEEEILEIYQIQDPDLILVLLHDKKKLILRELCHKAMTIQDLRTKVGLNPGTIKRHLDDLQKANLIFITSVEENEYHVRMKYYRAIAKHFQIRIDFP